ncbi:MAG: metal ABC transporter substrate-binding protein [Thaumarchaeota archaeon]|nr:metal ABC transporter substrate-binding protein [Candidatus Calditenuaceae archaeon]MDW8041408.1 metal ABC transporter substrate-binding protein [Nitrososphaerota archaeon]
MRSPRPSTVAAILLVAVAVMLAVGAPLMVRTIETQAGTGMTVAVSIGVLGEIVHRLSDGSIEVQVIIPPDSDPHHWEPTPRDIEKVRRSVLVLIVMKSFDGRISDLVRAAGSNAKVVEVSSHPRIRTLTSNGALDPHVWLSLRNYAEIVDVIASELRSAFPDLSERIALRAEKLKDEVLELYREYSNKFEKHRGKVFVTRHLAFRYLADDFGLRNLALTGIESEEPTARWLAILREEILRNNVRVIYTEPVSGHIHDNEQASDEMIKRFAEDLGLKVKVLDPLESLSIKDAIRGHGYLVVMRENLEAVLEGFTP